MKLNHDVAKENFDKLLEWLSPDREEAGTRFEQIRDGLIRYFRIKGCHEPEFLADESMSRVIRRIDSLDLSTGVTYSTLFFGFATNVFHEYSRSEKKRMLQFSDAFERVSANSVSITPDFAVDCLHKCLADLNFHDSKLLVEYYREDKQVKFAYRRQLATQNEMAMGALHTKIHRLKNVLRPCVEKCMSEKSL